MSIHAQTAILASRRKDFIGRNDKYGNVVSSGSLSTSIGEALRGHGPFDVSRQMFDERMRDLATNRLNRYRTFFRFYNGKHHLHEYQDGEKKPTKNFCRIIADKATEFYVAKGWKVKAHQGNELVADILNLALDNAGFTTSTTAMKQLASITGDGFMYVSVRTHDAEGTPLPKSQWTPTLTPLNPGYCFPLFGENGEIKQILIQYPLGTNPVNETLFSLVITPKTYQLFHGDSPLSPPQPNPFGRVNVVHFPNLPSPGSIFGQSELEDVVTLNESYNTTMFALERIIRYHAEPTTIIQGAKASNLEKGANRVWSNLPADAKVYNLESSTSLSELREYMKMLRQDMCEVSSTPAVCLDGSELPHSNTPGVTMEFMYKPLIDKTLRSWNTHRRPWKEVLKLFMLAHERVLSDDLARHADDKSKLDVMEFVRSSPMPRDLKTELEIAQQKKTLGIASRASLMREFSTEDTERMSAELVADDVSTLAYTAELKKAEQGIPPNLSAAFLSSVSFAEDHTELSKRIAALDDSRASK